METLVTGVMLLQELCRGSRAIKKAVERAERHVLEGAFR